MRKILIIGSTIGIGMAALQFLKENPNPYTVQEIEQSYENHLHEIIINDFQRLSFDIMPTEADPITTDLVDLYKINIIDRFDYIPP